MIRVGVILSLSLGLLAWGISIPQATQGTNGGPNVPRYTAEGRLMFPENYREWVFLTSGIDMNYNPAMRGMDHSAFDNVFVNPEAYKVFLETGSWPDKTVMMLEVRRAETKGSINKNGKFQTAEIHGLEIHVKDESRFPGKWAFATFSDDKPAAPLDKSIECYSCHEQHGAVDTTFTQFYPTLIDIAKKKGTLSAAYLKEEAAANTPKKP